ncbi:hypothetical protein [Cellulosimicrobium arenosum]|uniref:hypothetical protein n=1 Tax=Cellulosimicrobium arenosum TaxID=2708133 RepID=UPI001F50BE22|nr:hypothetical protein [Cellulosimicrobium arenosum]
MAPHATHTATHACSSARRTRITAGNFRVLDRLATQIERIQQVNDLHVLTPEIVDAARETLLIGH